MYNLPQTKFEDRGAVYADVIASYNDKNRPIRILEIGVFRAALIQGLYKKCPDDIQSYTGVDPYMGDERDPYLHLYWSGDQSVAEATYQESQNIFEQYGGTLHRKTSDQFFESNQDMFDVVIVDGDHSFDQTIKDLKNALAALNPGGLLVCDDYGNSDTPAVTKAVNAFINQTPQFWDDWGYRPLWFQNKSKHIPVQLSIVYWKKRK